MARDKQPPRTKKYFRPTKAGAGMTKAGVAKYRRDNPGSKLKTAVTGKVKPGSKAAKRRKSFCARSAGQMKKFPKAAKDPNSRLRQARRRDKQPPKTKKYFRPTKKGAGMTAAGVAKYRRDNPGSKLKTAVTGKVKPGSKDAKRRKSFCARSAGQMKKFPKAAKDPNSRLRQARRRWKC